MWEELEQQIQAVETLLEQVREKLMTAQALDGDRQNLEAQKSELETQIQGKLNARSRQELQLELTNLQTKLEDIDGAIAAQLVTWSSLKEPFWQIVRFGGLGFLLGIVVKGWAG